MILRSLATALLLSATSLLASPSPAPQSPTGPSSASAQTPPADSAAQAKSAAASAKTAQDAAKSALQSSAKALTAAGVAINGSTNVKDNLQVQAVLLPGTVAAHVFGNEIAEHYAVVQVVVDNHSEDSSFILQSLFLDSSQWLFSVLESKPSCEAPPHLTAADAPSCPGQLSSVEYRVIRGELQDASTWTVRNGIVRAATLVGAVGAGIPAFGSDSAIKYVSAYNGQLVPGLQIFWPDPTIAQLNHVSDLGYQTNKVFPKGSADVVYGFFPLDRILTPTLKRIFISSPALFIYPSELFVDSNIGRKHCFLRRYCTTNKDINSVRSTLMNLLQLPPDKDGQATALKLLTLNCDTDEASGDCTHENRAKATLLKSVLRDISLSRIAVTVGGVMSVNTQTIPASVEEITIDNPNAAATWASTDKACGTISGTVRGRYLTNGQVTAAKITLPGDKVGEPTDYFDTLPFATVSEGSTDSMFKFTGQLKNTIPTGSSLVLQVVKSNPEDADKKVVVRSAEYGVPVAYPGGAAPADTLLTTACKDRTSGTSTPAGAAADTTSAAGGTTSGGDTGKRAATAPASGTAASGQTGSTAQPNGAAAATNSQAGPHRHIRARTKKQKSASTRRRRPVHHRNAA